MQRWPEQEWEPYYSVCINPRQLLFVTYNGDNVMEFIDPKKTISTCISEKCDNCAVRKILHCHFTLGDLIHFYLIVSPTFLLGGAGIYHIGGWWLTSWLLIIIGFFGFVEIRVLCSHCPHYAEEGKSLRCWANYGSPKIWRFRPAPLAYWEKAILFAGFALVWGYPLIFLIADLQLLLLMVYLLTVAGFFMTLRRFLCSECMNFACPLNTVSNEVRRCFFEHNPKVAEAWTVDVKQ